MKHCKLFLIILLLPFNLFAQELFPLAEPASSVPKNTLGVKVFSETYKETKQWRFQNGIRLMYGVTPKLSVYLTALASNHHGDKMPSEFPFHNTPERGKFYPYKFNGFHAYAKYRFLTNDQQNTHFRMALYGEATKVKTTHHETEPNLEMGDNSGFGFGVISTYLKNKFAVSLTTGLILPSSYLGESPDPITVLPDVPIRVYYGNAFDYSLSFGYLLFPKKYTSYDQGNLNLYLSLKGKYYGAAKVDLNVGLPNEYYLLNNQYPKALQSSYFIDISPGIQYIIKSNLRIDFSASFRGLGFSYARLYPVYTIAIQRYFYF